MTDPTTLRARIEADVRGVEGAKRLSGRSEGADETGEGER
jgi:hypothetical protein